VATGGTAYYSKNLSDHAEITVNCNAWNEDVIEFELAEATEGRIKLSYGTQYFLVIDDVKLEYQGGVVTSALTALVTRAQTLNASLNSSNLTAAIGVAETFLQNPTTQDDVTTQVETLYTAMANALAATTTPVDITAAYLENASFETGKIDPWNWTSAKGTVGETVNTDSKPFYDGQNVVEFTTTGTNGLTQTITHLPAGYYALDAKLNGKAFLKVGTSSTLKQGGTDYLFLRVHPAICQTASMGEVTVGANASVAFRVDNFRLFYGKDEASLQALLLQDVLADGQAVIAMSQFASVTGSERTALQTALQGTDIDAINTAVNALVSAKDSYDKWAKAKTTAAGYTAEAYPYGSAALYEEIQTLCGTAVESATHAATLASELETACFNYYVSNYYCEGVEGRVDHTGSIAGANASGSTIPAAWTVENMEIRTDKTWTDPKTKAADKVVYGVTDAHYRTSKDNTSSMSVTLSNMPAGNYVLCVVTNGSSAVKPSVLVDNTEVGTLSCTGSAKYGTGWIENAVAFSKSAAGDMKLSVQYTGTANYQRWYFDNVRLYQLPSGTSSIDENVAAAGDSEPLYYDIQGRRIGQPAKGLYIVRSADGKVINKVLLK